MARLCSALVAFSDVMPGCRVGPVKCVQPAASFLAGCREACGHPDRLLRREPVVLEALNQDRRNGLIRAFSEKRKGQAMAGERDAKVNRILRNGFSERCRSLR